MDRDEYLGAVETGGLATLCIPPGQSVVQEFNELHVPGEGRNAAAMPSTEAAGSADARMPAGPGLTCPQPTLAEAEPPTEAPAAPEWTCPRAVPADCESPADAGTSAAIAPMQIIEALLFASDAPLSAARLGELAGGLPVRHVHEAVEELNAKYAAAGLSFDIRLIARGYQMMTKPQYRTWVAKLNQQRMQTRLSAAALEALSIIAYKQPIIRAEVEAIRGVACGDVLNRLREMGLVRIVGRAEILGRPMLYGTTRKFLDVFGLADLDDLPPMEALTLRRPPADAGAPPSAAAIPVPVTINGPALVAVGP